MIRLSWSRGSCLPAQRDVALEIDSRFFSIAEVRTVSSAGSRLQDPRTANR